MPQLLALLVAVLGWLALAPWRPLVADDDWGFYDSVLQTIARGRPTVSDWLNPSTVGLTQPTAWLVLFLDNTFVGAMVVMGLFGLAGLLGFWGLLQGIIGVPRAQVVRGVLILGFFPIFFGKWSRFESAVPGTSLLLVSLALLGLSIKAQGHGQRRSWLYLCLASGCIAWAMLIRQNHAVAIVVGALVLVTIPTREARGIRLGLWLLFPLLATLTLTLGLDSSFAQRTVNHYKLIEAFSPSLALSILLRGTCFTIGIAVILAVLISPRATMRLIREMPRSIWCLGILGTAGLIGWTIMNPQFGILAPRTNIYALAIVRELLLVPTVALGGAMVGILFPGRPDVTRSRTYWALLMMAAGYLLLTATWGYYEYYFMEPILLLLLAVLLKGQLLPAQSATTRAHQSRFAGGEIRTPWARIDLANLRQATMRVIYALVLAGYIGVSWYTQRLDTDDLSTRTQVFERAYRDGIVPFSDIDTGGAPFGLAGWNLFPFQIQRWEAGRQGNPLNFWSLRPRDPQVLFQWECADQGEAHQVLRSGTARKGLDERCWRLVRQGTAATNALPVSHRYLPLTTGEWKQELDRYRR